MGRDKGKVNRVKGNLKPSGSSQAAELLGNAAINTPVFLGFSSVSSGFGSSSASLGDGLTGELQVIIRKLEKRDPVTKQKACEELNSLLETDKTTIDSLLPFWAPLYAKLSIDADRKIRLGINMAHAKICKESGKKIAPHLKELIPPWLNSIFDSAMNEISKVSKNAFWELFNEQKRRDVLIFCLGEIIQYVFDNIVIKKPETLSDPRYTSAEDMASKYSRVISGCLYSLSHIIETVPSDKLEPFLDQIKKIVDSAVFWSFIKHSDILIRKSMYLTLQTLASKQMEIVQLHIYNLQNQFLPVVFTDKEPSTHQQFWDCIIVLSKKVPEIWQVDEKARKKIIINFVTFLQNACFGSVSVSYPSIIVVLSCFPNDILDAVDCDKLMDAFYEGLNTDHLDNARSEVFFRSYLETMIFMLTRRPEPERKLHIFQYSFSKIFDLYLLAHENRGYQEKINEFKFRSVLVDNINKFYLKQYVNETDLNELIFERLIKCVKSFVDLTAEKYRLIMKRIGLLFELQSQRSVEAAMVHEHFAKAFIEIHKFSLDILKEKRGVEGILLMLSITSGIKNLDTNVIQNAFINSPLLVDILPSCSQEMIPNLCRLIFNLSKVMKLQEYSSYWNVVISKVINSCGDRLRVDILCSIFDELGYDLRKDQLNNSAEFGSFVISLIKSKNSNDVHKLILHAILVSNILSSDTWRAYVEYLLEDLKNARNIWNDIGELPQKSNILFQVLSVEFVKSKYFITENFFDILGEIGFELICMKAISESSDEIISCWKSFKEYVQGRKDLLTAVINSYKKSIVDLDSTIGFDVFSSILKIMKLEILRKEVFDEMICSILTVESDLWSHLELSCDEQYMKLEILDPFMELYSENRKQVGKTSEPKFDKFGMTIEARIFAVTSQFLSIYGLDKLIHEIQMNYHADLINFIASYLVLVLNVSDALQIASEIFWKSEDNEKILASMRNIGLTLVEGLVRENVSLSSIQKKIIESNNNRGLLLDILKLLMKKSQFRIVKIILDYAKSISTEMDAEIYKRTVQIIENKDNCSAETQLVLSSILNFCTFSEKLKISSALAQNANESRLNALSLILGTRKGVKIEKGPFSDPPISLMDAGLVFDWIVSNCENKKPERTLLRCIEALLHYPALLEHRHWEFLLPLTRTLIEETSGVHLFWSLSIYLRILEAKECGSIPKEYEELLRILNESASMIVYRKFVTLDSAPYRGNILRFFENLISALIECIPIEVIRREWDYQQLLVPIGMNNQEIQKAAFKLLHDLTEELVIEISSALDLISIEKDEAAENQAYLPEPILKIVKKGLDFDLSSDKYWKNYCLQYLLASMILLDHFEYSHNMVLKSQYANHLKDGKVLEALLIHLFRILGLAVSDRKPFDLTKWEVQYFDVLELNLETDTSVQLLAAHVYWRILKYLPSNARTWFIECKNRQLSIAVENYTEKFFGQLIIQDELRQVQNLAADSFGDSMSIKISRGTISNEVVASYKIDETSLEMAIKLPNCYPLKPVEIEGKQRVGVNEERWRRWLLNCNVLMTSQNGGIRDALNVFKQNADKHFEGIEDCAICYSVIGMMDRSLPTKQCKTCKNKFHPACLYKWFKTSNNSSCPLCRTLF